MKNSALPQGDYDLVIVGGGMVGASLAYALAKQSRLRIAMIELTPFESDDQPSYDDRAIALSYGSRRIFEAMGVWGELAGQLEPINSIHVSDRGHFGATRLHNDEEGVEALGYVVENRVVGRVLLNRLAKLDHIQLLCPAALTDMTQDRDGIDLQIEYKDQKQKLRTRLLVAADGVTSRTRELLGIGIKRRDYGQAAVIANVTTEQPHNNVAYERFTDSGPVALLPMTDGRCSVVWTVKSGQLDTVLSLSDDQFLNQLQQRFGYRLGVLLKTGRRSAYPLALVEAEQLVKGRAVVIGNAAHTLHPVSGQGFNLALRDVAVLAELLATAPDAGSATMLQSYAKQRKADMARVFRLTDSLVKIFSNEFAPLGHARAAGLVALDLLPGLRHLLARQSMGLLGQQSKMMRRVPL